MVALVLAIARVVLDQCHQTNQDRLAQPRQGTSAKPGPRLGLRGMTTLPGRIRLRAGSDGVGSAKLRTNEFEYQVRLLPPTGARDIAAVGAVTVSHQELVVASPEVRGFGAGADMVVRRAVAHHGGEVGIVERAAGKRGDLGVDGGGPGAIKAADDVLVELTRRVSAPAFQNPPQESMQKAVVDGHTPTHDPEVLFAQRVDLVVLTAPFGFTERAVVLVQFRQDGLFNCCAMCFERGEVVLEAAASAVAPRSQREPGKQPRIPCGGTNAGQHQRREPLVGVVGTHRRRQHPETLDEVRTAEVRVTVVQPDRGHRGHIVASLQAGHLLHAHLDDPGHHQIFGQRQGAVGQIFVAETP